MSQRKYVRLSEKSHMQLRLLAATIDRTVPDVCEMLASRPLSRLRSMPMRRITRQPAACFCLMTFFKAAQIFCWGLTMSFATQTGNGNFLFDTPR